MLSASAPEEAFRRFDVLAARHSDSLRQLTKKVQDARVARDSEALKRAVIAYEEALEAYIPGTHTACLSLQLPSCKQQVQRTVLRIAGALLCIKAYVH